ncbi:MAG: PIN domain nuclease of toxin-antitoxin system [Enterobacterales bacterium]
MGCRKVILLDTHVLVWLSEGNSKLGSESVSLIDNALKKNELFVSSISFWEVAMLVEKRRIDLLMNVQLWRRSLIDNGIQEIDLRGDIAIESALLPNFHGDPADRIIVATAQQMTMSLCTADEKILNWQSKLLRINAKG